MLQSPVGNISIASDGATLTAIRIGGAALSGDPCDPLLREALAQLAAYFDGRLTAFDLPLKPAATPRGAILRNAIAAIPPGETASYGALAHSAGSSARAIGQACARNPFPIVIPCHRVLAANRAIGHYSAGEGVITKSWLLEHERKRG